MVKTILGFAKRVLLLVSGKEVLFHYDAQIIKTRQLKAEYTDKFFKGLNSYDPSDDLAVNFGYIDKEREQKNPDLLKAAEYRAKEIKLLINKYWARIWLQIYWIFLIILGGAILNWILPTIGLEVKEGYYAALSQIYPVLLIALYLTPSGDKGKSLDGRNRQMVYLNKLGSKITGVMVILLGLAVSLTVLATGNSSTFSLFITVVTLFIIGAVVSKSLKEASTEA